MAVALLVPALNEHRPALAAPAIVRSGTRFWPLVMAYGLFGFGYVITATFIVSMVRSSPNARSIEPFVWLVVGVFAIPSVQSGPPWLDAQGRSRYSALPACSKQSVSQ